MTILNYEGSKVNIKFPKDTECFFSTFDSIYGTFPLHLNIFLKALKKN